MHPDLPVHNGADSTRTNSTHLTPAFNLRVHTPTHRPPPASCTHRHATSALRVRRPRLRPHPPHASRLVNGSVLHRWHELASAQFGSALQHSTLHGTAHGRAALLAKRQTGVVVSPLCAQSRERARLNAPPLPVSHVHTHRPPTARPPRHLFPPNPTPARTSPSRPPHPRSHPASRQQVGLAQRSSDRVGGGRDEYASRSFAPSALTSF
ncbi:hypothetical protein B0H10DRAFT_2093977 [Mycena sp. CBHHK59/15]|nr:hypothetical protein B0H10DRAFT_2093977 [Mycena sp. CBHHK59/15]